MPGLIDPQTMYVDDLPTVWSPIQRSLTEEEHARELEDQATASLLWASPVPEQILRILLNETAIGRAAEAPPRFDPAIQGEWNASILTFAFLRPVELAREERSAEKLTVEYKVEGAGTWLFEFTADTVTIGRI
jgi:hypothetical protein